MDEEVTSIIQREEKRQQEQIGLIASENYASLAVRHAVGSVMMYKYAEGYSGKRYYQGCGVIDEIEDLAVERAKKLFGAEHVNVQPHSGSGANMAAYLSFLSFGDTIMGMALNNGGHLTHGASVNFSGTWFKSVQYGIDDEGYLDYDQIEKLAKEHRPKLIECGATAYSRTIDFERFSTIAKSVGAILMADISHISGLVAAGVHPSPFPFADIVTTTTQKTLRGPRGAMIMCKKEYAKVVDKVVFPFLQGGPFEHEIAAKAVAFQEALHPSFKVYQKQIIKNAKEFAEEMLNRGYKIVSGGTDNHLFVVDLTSKGFTGKEVAVNLEKANIIVSRASIPNDPQPPFITSGIRVGTPCVTTRGMKEEQMKVIADYFDKVVQSEGNETILADIKEKVLALTAKFPIPDHFV